ncbi:hypothetical protein BGX26_012192, partial [Mortierella sp. AD094]
MLQMDEDIGLPSVGVDVVVDIDVMKIYLEKLLVLLLGAEQADVDSSLFTFPDSTERLRRFAIDPQTPALYVLKETDSGGDANSSQVFSYSVSHELTYHANHVGSVALIKRGPTIDTSRPLQTQVQFINLPGPAANDSGLSLSSPYEALHSYIHYA